MSIKLTGFLNEFYEEVLLQSILLEYFSWSLIFSCNFPGESVWKIDFSSFFSRFLQCLKDETASFPSELRLELMSWPGYKLQGQKAVSFWLFLASYLIMVNFLRLWCIAEWAYSNFFSGIYILNLRAREKERFGVLEKNVKCFFS